MINGITKVLQSKSIYPFILSKSVCDLKQLMNDKLPNADEIYKFISVSGGFASISFIRYVVDRESIEELTASTLRVGEKQFNYLQQIAKRGKLLKARFFVGSIMKSDTKSLNGKYDYFTRFENFCKENKWTSTLTNNHSKIILMRTSENYYVLETSSNLNENPKIEQYSFENNKELYDFYYGFFDMLEKR